MPPVVYGTIFLISVVLTVIYVFKWQRHYNVNITVIFTLLPVIDLAYLMYSLSKDFQSAIISMKAIYLGGAFLPFFFMLAIFELCQVKINRVIRTIGMIVNSLLYGCVLTVTYLPWFYKSVRLAMLPDNRIILVKEYALPHTIFYAVLFLYHLLSIGVIIYTIRKKVQIPKSVLYQMLSVEVLSFVVYLFGRFFIKDVEITPILYVLNQFVYLMIVDRMSLYRTSDIVIATMVEHSEMGFITFDYRLRYLGSNDTAKTIIPALETLSVDQSILDSPAFKDNVLQWIGDFVDDNAFDKSVFRIYDPENEENDRIYNITVDYLYDGSRKRGYQVFIEDDTKDQKYIKLIDKYNTELEKEVESKTQKLVDMHNNLILSMATMVESRDNSTGGHIRRTSVCVRMLVDEILKDNALGLTEDFCEDLVKAAPMHDLGKIAVDDAVLRKPGRFTEEEFNEMKKHAAEGARIVHEILKDTDDVQFHIVAENVAHYHHERWDGSGYPDGLKGEEIPIEARIMAIADVYDALVSKRVYKESMSFEEADRIIMDGMGRHFDEQLKPYYIKARHRLEEYYASDEGGRKDEVSTN